MKRWTVNVLRKIILVMMIAIMMMFSMPNVTRAESDWGGVLIDPIISLFAAFGDTLTNIMAWAIIGDGSTQWDWEDFSWMPMVTESSQYYGPIEGQNFPEVKEYASDIQEKSGGYRVPCIDYSPREIFAGVVPALDINFISPNSHDEGDKRAVTVQLQDTIASWYVGLRNFSVIILLVVLVYVGIRMMLTSLAPEKAKYKQMFIDWVIALCLIFFLHYIMSFTLTMVETLTDALATNVTDINVSVYADENATEPEAQFSTNLTGLARFRLQYSAISAKFMYLIIYTALVIYTLMFTITYLKRVLIMAFLTLIAPLVCMTYPIDKIGDGKAQAFNFWLKEYIFNALLQPFHLLLYAIFIGSAFDLAAKNPIYALVALGFIFSAEKILRKMFGFEKSGTIDTLGAFAGGALVSGMIGKLGKIKGPEQKAIEEKEQANKIKPMNFKNGAYQGGGAGTAGMIDDGNGSAGSYGSNIGMTGGGLNVSVGGGTGTPQIAVGSGASRSGGTGSTSFLESLNRDSIETGRFTPMSGLATDLRNAGNWKERRAAIAKNVKKNANWDRAASGMAQVIASGTHKVGSKITVKNGAKALKAGTKFVAKTALRGGLAAGAGAVGLAAGIATGDLENALQMGIAGMVAGDAAGRTAFGYGEKGAKAVGKGVKDNIVTPYREGTLGVKEAKTQREFKEFNTEANRQKIAEEFRRDDGTYLSNEEIDERVQQCFELKQNGINVLDDQIEAVKLKEGRSDEYYNKVDEEMVEMERWVNNNMSQAEIDELREMSPEDKAKLRETANVSNTELASMTAKDRREHKAKMQKLDKMNKIDMIDNKDELYQKADQRAMNEAIMASQFKHQIAGMEESEGRKHIFDRFNQNGYTPEQATMATNKVLRDIDILNGVVKQ